MLLEYHRQQLSNTFNVYLDGGDGDHDGGDDDGDDDDDDDEWYRKWLK